MTTLKHGATLYGYGCRCDVCRKSHADRARAYRLVKKQQPRMSNRALWLAEQAKNTDIKKEVTDNG